MADPTNPTPAPPNPAPAPAPKPAPTPTPAPAPAPAPAPDDLRQKIDRVFQAAGELFGANTDQAEALKVVRERIDALFSGPTGGPGNPPTSPTPRSPRGRASR